MPTQNLISEFADVLDIAEAMVMQRWADTMEALGPAPFGWTKGTKWELLESYLELRDDPAAWQQMLTTYTMQVGEAAAVAKVVTDATAMERMLSREGGWTKEQQLACERASSVVAQAERENGGIHDFHTMGLVWQAQQELAQLQQELQSALLAGGQVVRHQQALRRLSVAEKGQKAAEKELAKPQALVSGPLVGLQSEQELITGVAPAPAQPAYPPSPYVTGLPPAMPPPSPFGPPQQMPQPQGVM